MAWGIWEEGLFIFRELASTVNYFREAGERAHSLGDFRRPTKKEKKVNLKNLTLKFFFFLNFFGFWVVIAPRPPCKTFILTCLQKEHIV